MAAFYSDTVEIILKRLMATACARGKKERVISVKMKAIR